MEFRTTLPLARALNVISAILGGIKCILIIFQFVKESFQTYKTTQQWQLDGCMNLFLSKGIISLLMYVLNSHLPHFPFSSH